MTSRPRRIPGLPPCPECNATVEELVHIAPGIAAAKPCGCVFAPGEFFPDAVLEADHDRELVADGGTWEHLGNPACHDERFRCTECGRTRSISNRSDQWREHGEPEPCGCSADTETDSSGGDGR